MTKIIRTNIIILSAICFVFTACSKFNDNEMIGVAKSLSAYEKFEQDILTGRVDSSVFIYDKDFGGLYVKIHYRTRTVEDGGDILVYHADYLSLSKTSATGVLEWNSTWGDGVQAISRPVISKNGNIHFIGYEWNRNCYLVFDKEGNHVMEMDLSTYNNCFICGPVITKDGGAIITGCETEFTNETRTEWEAYWTMQKINSNGEIEWIKRNGVEGIYEIPVCLIQAEDDGILVGIWKESSNGTDLTRLYIYLTSSNGIIENQTFICDGSWFFCDIIKANDGGYVLVTKANTSSSDFENIIITKLNSNGDILWQKSHPVGSGEVVYQYNEPNHDYYSHYIDFSVFNLMNSAYFLVDQCASDENAIKIYKFNNLGELID